MSTLEHRLLWMMLKRTGTSRVGEWTFDRSDLRDPVGEITVHWLPNGEAEVTAEPAPEATAEPAAEPEPAPAWCQSSSRELPEAVAQWFRERYRRPNRLPNPLLAGSPAVAHRIPDDQSGRDCTACRERRG